MRAFDWWRTGYSGPFATFNHDSAAAARLEHAFAPT
jgi:hypothetical protein